MWLTADTHKGRKRSTNQDTVAAKMLDGCCYCVVCDGMGGENGGLTAATLAIDTAVAQIERELDSTLSEMQLKRLLLCAGTNANIKVFDAAQRDPALKGMGTTMLAAVICNNMLHLIHAGDSRAYLLRDDMLTRITEDHTVVAVLLERGDITPEEAQNHPQRHLITRAVGARDAISFDYIAIELQEDDAVLLCSDGLYNYLSQSELDALCALAKRRQSVWPLIDRANENGGGDNITAALLSPGRRGEIRG